MEITRLVLSADERHPARSIHLDPVIAQIDQDEPTIDRVRGALTDLLNGSVSFGSAFLSIDDVELEVNDELATHLGHRMAIHRDDQARNLETREGIDRVALTALRAALELRGAIPPTLTVRSVSLAQEALQARQALLAAEIRADIADAARRRDEASESLDKIHHWQGPIRQAHTRSEEAEPRSRFHLQGPLARRRRRQARTLERQLLDAGNFTSFGDAEAYAATSLAKYREQLNTSTQDWHDAERALADLTRGAPTAASDPAPLRLVLELRRNWTSSFDTRPADHPAIDLAIPSILTLLPIDEATPPHAGNLIESARHALAELAAAEVEHLLLERIAAHAQHTPVLSSIPFVIDHTLAGLGAEATAHVLRSLEPFVGRVQLIFLGPDVHVAAWAARARQGTARRQ